MIRSARRYGAITICTLLATAVAGALWAQPVTPPQTAPATTSTAPATMPQVGTWPGVSTTNTMRFVFQDASVDTILNELSRSFGFIVIKSGTISGRITINVPEPVTADQAVRLLNSFLVPMGYSTLQMVTPGPQPEQKTVLRVVTLQEAKKSLIPVKETNKPEDIPNTEELMTVIIPLKNVDATTLRNDLIPVTSLETEITSNRGANSIVVTDTAAKIRRLLEIIAKLDDNPISPPKIEYYQLFNSSATEAAILINAMFNPTNLGQPAAGGQGGGGAAAFGARGGGAQRGGGAGGGTGLAPNLAGRVYAQGDARTNVVVLNGPTDQVTQAIEMLARIDQIDIDVLDTSVLFIYRLRNAQSTQLEPVLNAIFGTGAVGGLGRGLGVQQRGGIGTRGTGTGAQRGGTTRGTTRGRSAMAPLPQSQDDQLFNVAAGRGGAAAGGRAGGVAVAGARGAVGGFTTIGGRAGGAGATALSGQAYFVANIDTNDLLVTTDKRYEARVREIIAQLDRPVPQVLIKVLIAEVTHNNGSDIGFEFGTQDIRVGSFVDPATGVATPIGFGPSLGTNFGIADSGGGLKIGLVEGQVQMTLRALANQNKLDVLSRPYVLVQDNQEAYMIIGQEVPYITNTQITDAGQTINSVAYREVGIILDVTPHINPDGLVTMDIVPEISQLDAGSGVPISSNVNAPVFTVRQAQSRVAIKNGETIVIGGLMEDKNQQLIQKVPVLGDIPYLGMLFKRTTNNKTKTELLIFITPHVAMTPEVLNSMSEDEQKLLKLVPDAVQPGTWEQQMRGMESGRTTTQPANEIRIEGGVRQ